MMYRAKAAVCSQIRTKHSNAKRAPCRIFECQAWWYVKKAVGFEGLTVLWKQRTKLLVAVSFTPNVSQRRPSGRIMTTFDTKQCVKRQMSFLWAQNSTNLHESERYFVKNGSP